MKEKELDSALWHTKQSHKDRSRMVSCDEIIGPGLMRDNDIISKVHGGQITMEVKEEVFCIFIIQLPLK
jgi:hypothetical protein